MIAVLIRFELGKAFDEQKVKAIAEQARGMFEGLPGLRSKTLVTIY